METRDRFGEEIVIPVPKWGHVLIALQHTRAHARTYSLGCYPDCRPYAPPDQAVRNATAALVSYLELDTRVHPEVAQSIFRRMEIEYRQILKCAAHHGLLTKTDVTRYMLQGVEPNEPTAKIQAAIRKVAEQIRRLELARTAPAVQLGPTTALRQTA